MNSKMKSRLRLLAIATLSTAIIGCASTKSAVSTAQFEPVTGSGTALGAAPIDLGQRGYEEQEYFVDGTAHVYRFPGPMQNAVQTDETHDYTTRILVRRPTNPDAFNGTVVIEWLNVTLGQDIGFVWGAARDLIMDKGYVYVGVSAQHVGINDLKAWNPERYGSLNVYIPEQLPEELNPFNTRDVQMWDIFSQVVQTLRQPGDTDALPGMKVERVIATGLSQGGRALTLYRNNINPLHNMVDGFVYYDAGLGTWDLLREDLQTFVIAVGAETHSDRPVVPDTEYTRRWEVAGSSHVDLYAMEHIDAITTRDQSLEFNGEGKDTIQGMIQTCAYYPIWSAVRAHKVVNSAIDHINRWIVDKSTPIAPGLALEREPNGVDLRYDEQGRTYGGIQLAEFLYPEAYNLGGYNPGSGFCQQAGHHRYYTQAELQAMYPDPDEYLLNVTRTTLENVEAGYILPEDGIETIRHAAGLFE